jgi:pimeloyl-ACP methyl ester carboxylesterase
MNVGNSSELCRIVTGDGLQLEGLLTSPKMPCEHFPVSAALLVHGTGGAFYSDGVLEQFSLQAVDAGLFALRINTRGHDMVARIAGSSAWGGAAYEKISDCRWDLAAWITWLSERGHDKIALVGHSMGAVKAIYAMAHDWHESVRCVIAVSPPRFCHRRLLTPPAGALFRRDYERAGERVEHGRGDELLSVWQPLAMLITAEGFLAKYGRNDEYDYFKFLPKVPCPCLILTGSESVRVSPAFADVPEDLANLIAEHPNGPLRFELIEEADTGYSACPTEPFHRAERWLRSFPD